MNSLNKSHIDAVLLELGPALLKPEWKRKWTRDRPTTGYCYLVSEVIWHFYDEYTEPYCVNLDRALGVTGMGTHWWVVGCNGQIIDFTSDQFNFPIPYALGKRTAFFKGAVQTRDGLFISKRGFELAKKLNAI